MIVKEEKNNSGNIHSSFTHNNESCSSNEKNSQISKGIAIEQNVVDIYCIYGEGILSVPTDGSKYLSNEVSVKLRNQNKAREYIKSTNTYKIIEVKYNTSHHFVGVIPSSKNHPSKIIYSTNTLIININNN